MPTLPPDLDPGHERLRRVVFLSGTRADFGKIKSLIRVLEDAPGFEPHVFATGMHMEPRYGFTVREIEKCGFRHVYRYINQAASAGEMDRCLAQTIVGFGDYLRLVQPDLVVVHGDRGEALAGALCGSLNNVRVAHVEGGDAGAGQDHEPGQPHGQRPRARPARHQRPGAQPGRGDVGPALVEAERAVSGATLLSHFGAPPYGYVGNVVRACVAGLLRAAKLRIQTEREERAETAPVAEPTVE